MKSTTQLALYFPIEEKIKVQERANRIPAIPMDLENITATLPLLLPHQLENVLKAERRFFTPAEQQLDGINKGMLYTDNTGSGKTFSGLGIMKRFERFGHRDILVVVPTDAKAKDWIEDGRLMGIFLYQLKSTKDAGPIGSMVITTYANMRDNKALLARADKKPFALVVYDESHKIMSNESGAFTNADDVHKHLTNAPDKARLKAEAKLSLLIDKDLKEFRKVSTQTEKLIEAEAKKLVDATKVVFLSATPFSYHKNLQYADGYLFRIRQGCNGKSEESFKSFFVSNFGYRILYNKLTEPDAKVDVGIMERAFHTKLIKAGCVSSTRLQLDKDYSREFILIDAQIGMLIDQGYEIASDRNTYKYLHEVIEARFSSLYKNQLLECIKAKFYIPRIKEQLALGRKVVIFHSYNNSLPVHPFDLYDQELYPVNVPPVLVEAEIKAFHAKYPQFRKLDLSDLTNPIKTLMDVFADVALVFNGTVSPKERMNVKRLFNNDDSGKDILIGQMEACKEGLSLHDTTGKKQRVSINLALPVRPTDAIQTEGRIYRIGQKTNAVIEYPVLHLNFEKLAFAEKISERVKTAENLAFGEQARNLKEAFKEGYKNPITDAPHAGQGVGSRDADMVFDTIDPYTMAIKLYFNRGKRNEKTKAKEGIDYYATPEPLGYKMAEWLYSRGNDQLLEPSAGHGAIARFFPEDTVNKFIEPSYSLRSDLAINATGAILTGNFEDLHIVNKFQGIAMNPPFGTAGKTAMEHLEKATQHLSDGGRVIVILPDGPAMNTRLEKWSSHPDQKNCFITAKVLLPSVTFERAGTSVVCQLLVIDKQTSRATQLKLPEMVTTDLRHIADIEALFAAIKDINMPKRFRQDSGNGYHDGVMEASTVIAGKHTKFGYSIWTVKMIKKLSETQFEMAHAKCIELGGYYSSYSGNNAIVGFIFKGVRGPEGASALKEYINNL